MYAMLIALIKGSVALNGWLPPDSDYCFVRQNILSFIYIKRNMYIMKNGQVDTFYATYKYLSEASLDHDAFTAHA